MSVYVGADIHKASTTFVVLDEQGKFVSDMTTKTTKENLLTFVRALRGPVHLTFEESSYASWLWDVLHPHVATLVVCDPRQNPQIKANKKKSDHSDARLLADALRTNSLTSVYHGKNSKKDLKELIKSYDQLVADRTRTKNRINHRFSSRGVRPVGRTYYVKDEKTRQALIDQLAGHYGMQVRLQALFAELDVQDDLVKLVRKAMLAEGRKFDEVKRIETVPGFGPIRATQFVGWIQSPYRFRTKKQLFSYIGLGIVTRGSAEWVESSSGLRRDTSKIQTRGLNNQCQRSLKAIIKGAAKDACVQHESWKRHHDMLVDEGMRSEMARLIIARKLASTVLSLWKNGGEYSDEKAILRS